MDMKRLKNSMWTLLTDSPEKPTEVNYTPRISFFFSVVHTMTNFRLVMHHMQWAQLPSRQPFFTAFLFDSVFYYLFLGLPCRGWRLWRNLKCVERKCSVRPQRRCFKGISRSLVMSAMAQH